MLLVAELNLRQLQLALALDIGLERAVDHDVRDGRIGQQLFERPQAQQFVDQHLLKRELLAAVERELQLGEHLANDRAELLGELVLAERGGRLGVHALQEAGEHLLLDLVDRRLEPVDLGAAIGGVVLPVGEARHGVRGGARLDRIFGHALGERERLGSRFRRFGKLGRGAAAVHRARDTEGGAGRPASSAAFAERTCQNEPQLNRRTIGEGE